MKPEAQRIAIAEACKIPMFEELGIRYKDGTESWGQSPEYTVQKCENYQRKGLGCELVKRKQTVDNFDPLSDLNAMHEAEKAKGFNKQSDEAANYYTELLKVCDDNVSHCATAPQRAEAFLRTLNLWND